MELPPHGTDRFREEPLDDGVDIFVGEVPGAGHGFQLTRDLDQALVDTESLLRRQDTGPGKAGRPRPASPHIVTPQTPVHVKGPVQDLHFAR